MSDPIGPGDWVENFRNVDISDCVPIQGGASLVLGEIYKVHAVVPGCDFADDIAALEIVGFEEIIDGNREAWDIRRFRPIHRPGKSTLIQELKTTIKEGVRS